MPRETKNYHPSFNQYVRFIVNHSSYSGLSISKNEDGTFRFVEPKDSKVGQERLNWIKNKAISMGLNPDQKGVLAVVMRKIHPTKYTTCQICGNSLSIFYYYPNKPALKSIQKEFGIDFSYVDHIEDIWDSLLDAGFTHEHIGKYFLNKVSVDDDPNLLTKEEIIERLELACREEGRRLLGPGAMSDAPDRFDGFHSYNRCCRKTEDRGRWDSNMDTYNQDRRAYENWSEGNIRAANQFMKNPIFNGISADHIGPISLGFVHDPRFIRPMVTRDNSARRDRISKDDLDKLVEIEERTGICAASWYAQTLWNYIKTNYAANSDKIETVYYAALKQNITNFMHLLYKIVAATGNTGESILASIFLLPIYTAYFDFDYTFDSDGNILQQTPRNRTERAVDEYERYKRVAIDSLNDYSLKTNRKIKPKISSTSNRAIDSIISLINNDAPKEQIKSAIVDTMTAMQQEIIQTL